MNNRNILLVALAAIAAIVGWVLNSGNTTTSFESEAIFVDLQKQLHEVDTLQIESSQGVLLSAVKSGAGWVAANKQNYPLDSDEVITLLNAFATAELNDAKTAKAENYARLGLTAVTQQDSQASLVSLKAGERAWKILVGNTSSSGNGMFVRKPDDVQSWLTRTMLDLPVDETDWLETQVLDLPVADVMSISKLDSWAIQQDVKTVSENPEQPLNTEDVSQWHLDNMPEGRELKYDTVLENTAEDILAIKFESLRQLRPIDITTMSLQSETMIETKQLGKIKVSLLQQDDTWFALYDAIDRLEPAPDYHWQDWVYELSDFHAGRLTKTLEDFLTELPEENAE